MRKKIIHLLLICLIVLVAVTAVINILTVSPQNTSLAAPAAEPLSTSGDYIVLSWNDLGMHCYNQDFQDLAVLPPFNTLWAQVVRVGDPPEIITNGVTVTYEFPDNTYSIGKSNFWDYDQDLFGVDLPDNVGLAGKGLAGDMDALGDHFVAEGIPLTEFSDSDLNNPEPYQLALVKVLEAASGAELTQSTVVAPVSTEMHCDNCHFDGGVEDISTGRVETNILVLHDNENQDEYPAGHETPLMERLPILCAECHESNALNAPGLPGIPSLSRAIHKKHDEDDFDSLDGCYNCHPGPQTKCLRDTMWQSGMDCIDCHGGMKEVSQNPKPWLNEPRCDDCHDDGNYDQDQALYRLSKDHGGLYCAACHDSPHAIAPSAEPRDNIKFIELQGHSGTLQRCTVCHATQPELAGPHGLTEPNLWDGFLPIIEK